MFVQSHFQRARHQAPSASSTAGPPPAPNLNQTNRAIRLSGGRNQRARRATSTKSRTVGLSASSRAAASSKRASAQTSRRRSRSPLDCERLLVGESTNDSRTTTSRRNLAAADEHVNQQMRPAAATHSNRSPQQTLTAQASTRRQPSRRDSSSANVRLRAASLSDFRRRQSSVEEPAAHSGEQQRPAEPKFKLKVGPEGAREGAGGRGGSRFGLISASRTLVLTEVGQVLRCCLLFVGHFIQHQWRTLEDLVQTNLESLARLVASKGAEETGGNDALAGVMRHNQLLNFGAQNQSFDWSSPSSPLVAADCYSHRQRPNLAQPHHEPACCTTAGCCPQHQHQPAQQAALLLALRHGHLYGPQLLDSRASPMSHCSPGAPTANHAYESYTARSYINQTCSSHRRPPLQTTMSHDLSSLCTNSRTTSPTSSTCGLFMGTASLAMPQVKDLAYGHEATPGPRDSPDRRSECLHWPWHMRHTVDSSPFSGRTRPMAACTPAELQFSAQPPNSSVRHTGARPQPGRATSASSPTLMESSQLSGTLGAWPGQWRGTPEVWLSSGAGPLQGRAFVRELEQPQSYIRDQQQPVGQFSGHFTRREVAQRVLDRRLSSIVGSDSELYKQRRPSNGLGSAGYCGSSSSSLSSKVNLSRLAATAGQGRASYIHQPASSPAAATRRRLGRQASSTTSGTSASQLASAQYINHANRSHYCNHYARTAWGQRGGGARSGARGPASSLWHSGQTRAHVSRSESDAKMPAALQSRPTPTRDLSAATGRQQQKVDPDAGVPHAKQQSCLATSEIYGRAMATAAAAGAHSIGTDKRAAPKAAAAAAAGKSKSAAQTHNSAGLVGKVSLAGARRRLGFKQKGGLNSLSVHRSEEIFPSDASELLWSRRQHYQPARSWAEAANATQHSAATSATNDASTASNSLNDSCDLDLQTGGSRWLQQQFAPAPSGPAAADPKTCFVEGLGVGQIASRQALVSPYLGDIQVSLSDRRGMLEVEIIRVRQLQSKAGAQRLPAPYVKVYLMRDKKCVAKFKTSQCGQTLDPLYQQQFIFRHDYANCVLQIIVWGDYGKKDRKSLMGIVQIHLNELDMSNVVVGWYKLFNAPSMVALAGGESGVPVVSSSKSLRQTLSSTKLARARGEPAG